MNDRINVCIMYANENSYSETFIKNQIQNLPENVFPLYGAWFPFLEPGRKHILSRNPISRLSRRIRRNFLGIPQSQLMIEGMRNYLRKKRIDVVLAHYALTGIAVMECCAAESIPLVVHFHGFDAFDYKVLAENEANYKRLFQLAAKIIAVSQHMRDQLCHLGCAPEKLEVNPCGVDTNFFTNNGSLCIDPNFVAVARFSPIKGPQYTLRAFQLVLQEIPNAKLVMVGEGELWEKCKALAKSLHVEHAVKFPGALPPEGILNVLRESRIFVQHGIKNEQVSAEGMGLTVMEASSTGLPVVATRHGGFKESVLEGETGLLVEEGDVTAMAEAMKRLAKDDALSIRMGEKGRERMKELFDLPKSIDRLTRILREAAGL